MQDNLYRKIMQKSVKIENGFEIIQSIYNGKKMIQKRKIKEENWFNGFGGFKKGKMKNDIRVFTNFGENATEKEIGD